MLVLCMAESRTAVMVRYAADLNEKGAADLATQKHFIAAQRRSRRRLKDRTAQLRREVQDRPHSLHHKRSQVMGQGRRAPRERAGPAFAEVDKEELVNSVRARAPQHREGRSRARAGHLPPHYLPPAQEYGKL